MFVAPLPVFSLQAFLLGTDMTQIDEIRQIQEATRAVRQNASRVIGGMGG